MSDCLAFSSMISLNFEVTWSFSPCLPLTPILQNFHYSWSESKTQNGIVFLTASSTFQEIVPQPSSWSEEQGFIGQPGFNLMRLPGTAKVQCCIPWPFCGQFYIHVRSSIHISVKLCVCDPMCFSLLLFSFKPLYHFLFIQYSFIHPADMCQVLF